MKNEIKVIEKPKEKVSNPYREGITVKGFGPQQKFSTSKYLKAHKRNEIFFALFNK